MEAAAEVGFLRKVPVLVDGVPEVNATNGAPTGRMEWEMNPEEGLKGYLKWLCIHNSTAWVIGEVMPMFPSVSAL